MPMDYTGQCHRDSVRNGNSFSLPESEKGNAVFLLEFIRGRAFSPPYHTLNAGKTEATEIAIVCHCFDLIFLPIGFLCALLGTLASLCDNNVSLLRRTISFYDFPVTLTAISMRMANYHEIGKTTAVVEDANVVVEDANVDFRVDHDEECAKLCLRRKVLSLAFAAVVLVVLAIAAIGIGVGFAVRSEFGHGDGELYHIRLKLHSKACSDGIYVKTPLRPVITLGIDITRYLLIALIFSTSPSQMMT